MRNKLLNKNILVKAKMASTPLNEVIFSSYNSFVLVFDNQQSLDKAIGMLQLADQEILDVQSPHYINVKGLNKTRKSDSYGIISGICGVVGLGLMALLIFYVMSKPQLLLGNKGSFPIMDYIPVLFTVSILFSGLGLWLAFGIKNHLLPGQQNQIIDPLATSDHYLLIIHKNLSLDELKNQMAKIDTITIFEHKFIQQNICLPLALKMK